MISKRLFAGSTVGALAAAALTTLASVSAADTSASATTAAATAARPNIVFVLVDDFSNNLTKYMPHVTALKQRGMTFTNYSVTDSLCCPSRTSILTGEFPHNSEVKSNNWLDGGGYKKFETVGDQNKTFAVAAQQAGVATAFFGKYLNEFTPAVDPATGRVPNELGWDIWGGVDIGGYKAYHYKMVQDGQVLDTYNTPESPQTYMTNVLSNSAASFLDPATPRTEPFILEVGTFAPHSPFVPAPRDLGTRAGLRVPHIPDWDHHPRNAPGWLKSLPLLTSDEEAKENLDFEHRVESMQDVDRMIARLENILSATGQLSNTYFVFSSDNGYHLGNYGLISGKETPYDIDVRVPLVIAGPGIAPGSVNNNVVENIDLAPTFERLEGLPIDHTATDGHSLVPLLHGQGVPWRTVALIEHTHTPYRGTDPDRQVRIQGNPPSYTAIRTAHFTYVHYVTRGHEFYNRDVDPYEMNNIYPGLSSARKAALAEQVTALQNCTGYHSCWTAAAPQ